MTRVAKAEGSSHAVWTRGKGKLTYEYAVEFDWRLDVSGGGGSGSGGGLEGDGEGACRGSGALVDVADTEADGFDRLTVQVQSAGGGLSKDDAAARVKKCGPAFTAAIKRWADAVKAL